MCVDVADGLKKAIARMQAEGLIQSSDPSIRLWAVNGLLAYMVGWTEDKEPEVSRQFLALMEAVRG